MQKKNSSHSLLYRSLSLLSTEELEEVLRTDRLMTGEDASDEEVLITITDILLEREPRTDGITDAKSEAALEAFWRDTAQDAENHARAAASEPKQAHRRWRLWLAGAAAMLVIGIPTAQAFHLNIIYIVQQLIAGQFAFVSNNQAASPVDITQFQKILAANQITVSLDGLWLPEGFTPTDIIERKFLDFELFQLQLVNHEKESLVIDVMRYKDDNHNRQLESLDQTVEIYVTRNREFYIIHNDKNISAAFFEKNTEVTIYGDIQTGELHKIIDSIG